MASYFILWKNTFLIYKDCLQIQVNPLTPDINHFARESSSLFCAILKSPTTIQCDQCISLSSTLKKASLYRWKESYTKFSDEFYKNSITKKEYRSFTDDLDFTRIQRFKLNIMMVAALRYLKNIITPGDNIFIANGMFSYEIARGNIEPQEDFERELFQLCTSLPVMFFESSNLEQKYWGFNCENKEQMRSSRANLVSSLRNVQWTDAQKEGLL